MTVVGRTYRRVRAFGRAIVAVAKALPQLSTVDMRGGWWPIIRESFAGAWQQNITVDTTTVLSFAALYACISLIASDVAKCRPKLVAQDEDGIWVETTSPSFSPVLRKPNHYQTRIQFYEAWIVSKLAHGNTYVLKVRDARRVVIEEHVLDPLRVTPLVAPNGDVYYELKTDDLAGLAREATVPASEIIHDRMTPLFHPLVGVSPVRACGLAALQGLKIQENSTLLFQNGARPGGVLTAPGHIPADTAARLKEYWDNNFTGENVGKVAILGDGLKFERGMMSAADTQLIEQLKWTAENVCTAFKVPPYKVNVGPAPQYNNVEALDQQYYSQCLQIQFESIELLQDEGLGLAETGPQTLGVEFDLDDLMRMDTTSRVRAASEAIKGSGMAVNEARRKFHGLGPAKGGDAIYMQQQMFSLEALAERDASKPFVKPTKPTPPPPTPTAGEPQLSAADAETLLAKQFDELFTIQKAA